MNNEPKITISHGVIYANSKSIDTLLSDPKYRAATDPNNEAIEIFCKINFHETTVKDKQGKPRRAFSLTRDGFDLIAMGLTGTTAMLWKVRYIYAFHRAEIELHNRREREKALDQLEMFPDALAEPEYTIAEVLEKLALFGLFNARTTASGVKSQIKRGDLQGRFDGRRWLVPRSAVKTLISQRELSSN